MRKGAPYGKVGAVAAVHKGYHFANHVVEELGMHAGCAYAADLFLVHIQANGGAGWLFNAEQRRKGSIGTYAVVMTMGNYKAAVEANVARSAGGNSLKLGGYEVLFGYAVTLV